MILHITTHAIERYQERVSNLPDAEVRRELSTPAIECAAAFGAPFVRLGTGQRVVLDRNRIVTVLPAETHPGTLGFRREVHRHG